MSTPDYIGKAGEIQSGEYLGWDITIEYDAEETGGYYLYLASANKANSFDHWFEDKETLDAFLLSVGWRVNWS